MGAPDGMHAGGLLAARPSSTADVHACSLAFVPQNLVLSLFIDANLLYGASSVSTACIRMKYIAATLTACRAFYSL